MHERPWLLIFAYNFKITQSISFNLKLSLCTRKMKKSSFILLVILLIGSTRLLAQQPEVTQVDPSVQNHMIQSAWKQIKITWSANTYFRISSVNGNVTFDFKYQDSRKKAVDKGQQLALELDDNEVVTLASPQDVTSCKGCGSIGHAGRHSQGVQIAYPLSSGDIAKLKLHKVVKYRFSTKKGDIERHIPAGSANKIMDSVNLF